MDLLYIAKKYCVDRLTQSCLKFLKANISVDNVCQIMEGMHAILESESEVYKQCLSFIRQNFTRTITSSDFETISLKCLEDIMTEDNFVVKEEELYENLIRWAESECQRQKLDVSWENKRKVLGDILYKVRFPLMESAYFTRKVATTDLLSDAEKEDLMSYHVTEKDIVPTYFEASERVVQVMRGIASTTYKAGIVNNHNKPTLGFKVSHDYLLHGILVFGCNAGTCTYRLRVKVGAHDNKTIERQLDTIIDTSFDTEVYHIMFDTNLHVEADRLYVVCIDISGKRKTYRAENVKRIVPFGDGKTVAFFHSSDDPRIVPFRDGMIVTYSNSKEKDPDTCFGQIPGLLLT